TRLFLDDVEALVEDALGRAALAAAHHAVDELGDERAVVQRIGRDVALGNFSSSWHLRSSRLRASGFGLRECLPEAWSLESGAAVKPSSGALRHIWNVPASA